MAGYATQVEFSLGHSFLRFISTLRPDILKLEFTRLPGDSDWRHPQLRCKLILAGGFGRLRPPASAGVLAGAGGVGPCFF